QNGEAVTSDRDRVHRLGRAGGARCRREGGRDDSMIPRSSRPFTHSPSPSPPQPVPSSSAPVKICPSVSLPDNCPRLLPLRRPPRSRARQLRGSHPRLLPMPRTDQETASKRGLAQDYISEELCVVLPGVVALFDGSDFFLSP
ncbi:hypothetical protein MUK42_35104, partial [Musa troglodytarum]